jgi:hypothetical protein
VEGIQRSLSISKSATFNVERRVKFSPSVAVILIPSVAEYVKCGIRDQIWWSDVESSEFKIDAAMELQSYLRCHQHLDCHSALKELYQGNNNDQEYSIDRTSSNSSLETIQEEPEINDSQQSPNQLILQITSLDEHATTDNEGDDDEIIEYKAKKNLFPQQQEEVHSLSSPLASSFLFLQSHHPTSTVLLRAHSFHGYSNTSLLSSSSSIRCFEIFSMKAKTDLDLIHSGNNAHHVLQHIAV